MKCSICSRKLFDPIAQSKKTCYQCRQNNNQQLLTTNDIDISLIYNKWFLDGKYEESDLFYDHNIMDRILNGKKFYIIGRKGTGKTLLGKNLSYTLKNKGNKPIEISFKGFPFNILYDYSDNRFTNNTVYITIWKYFIYASLFHQISPDSVLKKIVNNTEDSFKKVTSKEFVINIFNILQYKSTHQINTIDTFSKITHELENKWLQDKKKCTHYIIIDELDEEYIKSTSSEYFILLTSLFKAVQNIHSIFKDSSTKVYPIVLLRDDIYKRLEDNDKNKWKDFEIALQWDTESLQELLTYKISKTLNLNNSDFNQVWHTIFKKPTNRSKSIFEEIKKRTHLRPRDFVFYITKCIEKQPKGKISLETVEKNDHNFSEYLKQELIDELTPLLPHIEGIFDILAYERKQTISYKSFINKYEKLEDNYSKDGNTVLNILYKHNIIGIIQNTKHIFAYSSPDSKVRIDNNLTIHRGLYKSLEIY
ncbi:MAG: P-loop ATPase, Sll1717 family [Brevinema sp.]